MEEDKEIDKLNFDINQLINKCIILNKYELTATARVMLGRDIILRFINILQENKQLKEENKELRLKNNAIKRESEAYAERMINLNNELNLEKEKSKYEIKIIKELKEENKDLKMKIQFISKNNIDDLYEKALIKIMTKFLNDNIKENYIPVSKIKEKIKELDKEEKQQLKGTKGQDRYAIKQEFMYKRNILQELLEGK